VTFKTSRAVGVLVALAVPLAALATAPLAHATVAPLEFALDANGTPIPVAWTQQGTYYTNDLTVYFSGATPGDSVSLQDDTTGTAIGDGIADSDGDGVIIWNGIESAAAAAAHSVYLTDADDRGSDDLILSDLNVPTLVDDGPVFDSSTQQMTTGEQFAVHGAIPDEPVDLYLDGLQVDFGVADAAGQIQGGNAVLQTGTLSPGEHAAYAESVDASGVPSGYDPIAYPSETLDFTTWPIVAGIIANHTGFANTPTPTLHLTGIASNATAVTLYEQNDAGDISPVDTSDYTTNLDTLDATATVEFGSPIDADGDAVYWVTQTAAGVESGPGEAPTFGLMGIDATAPIVTADFAGSTTTEEQPSFSATTDGGDDFTFGVQYTLSENGQTLANSAVIAAGDSWQVPNPLADGTYSVTAVTVDELGEIGAAVSAPVTFTVDTPVASTPTPAPAPVTTPAPVTLAPIPVPITTITLTPAPPSGVVQPTVRQTTSALTDILSSVGGHRATTHAVTKNGGYSFRFQAPSAGVVTVDWYATVNGKKTLVGSVSEVIGEGGKPTLKLKLDATGRRLLNSTRRPLKISESASFTPEGGKLRKAGKTITLRTGE
jgi:large repetitive protein